MLASFVVAEDGWWLKTVGRQVSGFDEFKTLLTETDVDKVVVADFYMKNCYWCQKFQADWNRIVQDFTDSYEGNVVFYKIDGPDSPQITNFLHIESYPSFILWKPNSQGSGSIYQGRRAYEDMKEWIIMGANAANLTLKEGGPIKAAVPWPGADKTDSPKAKNGGKDSGELTANVAWLAENAKTSNEEMTKLLRQTQ